MQVLPGNQKLVVPALLQYSLVLHPFSPLSSFSCEGPDRKFVTPKKAKSALLKRLDYTGAYRWHIMHYCSIITPMLNQWAISPLLPKANFMGNFQELQ
jgi:hypothetical protein